MQLDGTPRMTPDGTSQTQTEPPWMAPPGPGQSPQTRTEPPRPGWYPPVNKMAVCILLECFLVMNSAHIDD